MKICLAQLNYLIGDLDGNTERIRAAIRDAKKNSTDLIVFAELAICGYPPRDLLEYPFFIKQCEDKIKEIAAECDSIAAIIGSPSTNPDLKGKNMFNSAFFLYEGKVQYIARKALLPTYDVFDEYRYFEPGTDFSIITFKGKKIALTVCEDLWDLQDDPMYTINPMDEMARNSPDVMVNIAASPFSYMQAEKRKDVLRRNTKKYKIPLLYVNHTGAQTELIFDGGSLAMSRDGEVIEELPYFKEASSCFVLKDDRELVSEVKPHVSENRWGKERLMYEGLVLGVRDFFSKMGFSKATLGLSGGIDSALVLAIAAEALGKENVVPVLLPSGYSSEHSVTDAVKLCENLGCSYQTIPIEESFQSILKALSPSFKGTAPNVAEENIQARIRGLLLMALTNKFGYILLNTSNKSEVAVGYGTLYGDMCGGLAVIGDVYKTEVYSLCDYINRDKEIIPRNTLTKAPSAELRPGQKDSDSLPDYSILDKVLYHYIERQLSPEELLLHGFDKALVSKVVRLVNLNEYKRYQTPPILRVSPKAFGMGRRMPIVGKYFRI